MSDERKRDSDRVLAERVEAETREIQKSTTQRARKRLLSIDDSLDLDRRLQRYVEDDKPATPQPVVLVVSSDHMALRDWAAALAASGCVVYCASDGLDALARLAQLSRIDALIVDADLQSFIGGRQLLRCVEETPFAATPALLLRQPGAEGVRRRGLTGLVDKPVEAANLGDAVKHLIARAKP